MMDKNKIVPRPGMMLIEVMGGRIVIALAIGSVILAIVLCLIGVFCPTLIPSQTARFFLCVLVSFLFAVFVFTLFPAKYEIDLKFMHVPAVLVGPAALWLILFFVLWHYLPSEDDAARLIRPAGKDDVLMADTTWVLDWQPTEPEYYLVPSSSQGSAAGDRLAGFLVYFDKANHTYTGTVGVGPSKTEIQRKYRIEFRRSDSTYRLESQP